MTSEEAKEIFEKFKHLDGMWSPDEYKFSQAKGFLEGMVTAEVKALVEALKMALGAFENNNAIDWNELNVALSQYELAVKT